MSTTTNPTTLRRTPVGETSRSRPRTVTALLGTIAGLCTIGLAMVMSASSVNALHKFGSSWYFTMRQAIAVAIGSLALWVLSRIDYHVWRRWALPALGVATVLLLAVLIPGVGQVAYGARRWLGAGPVQFQPSEIAKLAVLLFAADVLSRHPPQRDGSGPVKLVLVAVGVLATLVMLQPDMGTTMVVVAVATTVLLLGGTPLPLFATLSAALAAIGTAVAVFEPYRRARLMSFIDPFSAGQPGYQVAQSFVGLGSGGLTGLGLGASRAKWGFLPNAHTDFIFAIIGEELGLIGALVVVGMFTMLGVFGLATVRRAPDAFGALIAGGVTAWLVGQAALNMATVVGALPVTGVPLPFVSLGGTSTVICMAAAGILVNVARQGEAASPRNR
ncbi:MAG TPA: putative lipid II flippase FtsW [Acidimicrobiales bacterium]|nr:putative lipid II flippase FtsW [Acidimicrobiales bacterium]